MEEKAYAFKSFILHVPYISFSKVHGYLLMKCGTSGIEPGTKQISTWQHNIDIFKKKKLTEEEMGFSLTGAA